MSNANEVSAASAQDAVPVLGPSVVCCKLDYASICDGCGMCRKEAPASPSFDFAWESHIDNLLLGIPQEVA